MLGMIFWSFKDLQAEYFKLSYENKFCFYLLSSLLHCACNSSCFAGRPYNTLVYCVFPVMHTSCYFLCSVPICRSEFCMFHVALCSQEQGRDKAQHNPANQDTAGKAKSRLYHHVSLNWYYNVLFTDHKNISLVKGGKWENADLRTDGCWGRTGAAYKPSHFLPCLAFQFCP